MFFSQKSLCQLKFFKESLQQEKETHILVFFKLSVMQLAMSIATAFKEWLDFHHMLSNTIFLH